MDTTSQAPTILPNGTQIAPNQVNVGTVDAPNIQTAQPPIINTSSSSRNTSAKSSADLNTALAMYGLSTPPVPGAATPNTTNVTTTTPSTTVNADGSTNTDQNMSIDPYIQSLNNISTSSNASTKLLVNSILAAKSRNQNSVDSQYNAYKQGLQLLGVQHNEAQSTPDLLMGHIQSAENDHQQKLQDIESNTAKALVTAQQAQEDNDFKTLNAQMSYIKQLNAEKAQVLKNYQTSLTQQPKLADGVAHSVYGILQTLSPDDQETFLQSVSQKYNLPLGTLVTALGDEKTKSDAATAKVTAAQLKTDQSQVLSPTEAKTLGVKYGTTKADAAKMGIVPTTAKKGASATGTINKEQIAFGEKKLQAAKGADGFVAPEIYKQAYDSWTSAGGTSAKFITTYPPKNYVNPAATTLPSYLMPAKAKAAASSGRKS